MNRELLPLNRLLLLIVFACASTLTAQGQEWIHPDSQDDIETYYQAEKVGTDKFDVRIRVQNNRSKAIKVIVRVLYKVMVGD